MTFKGLLNHIEDIEALATEFPDTKVFIDHMGFCSAAEPAGKDWHALFGLARFPQVYVKVRSNIPCRQPLAVAGIDPACVPHSLHTSHSLPRHCHILWGTLACEACQLLMP